MIIAVDIETVEYDGHNNFVLGICRGLNKRRYNIFESRDKLWNYLIEKGKAEERRGKNLIVYSHYAKFDFYNYADIFDKNLIIRCHSPFIASYRINEKDCIWFYDTYSIFKMSLKELGDMLELPKLDMPEGLIEDKKIEMDKLIVYCKRDVDICLKAIEFLKRKDKDIYYSVRNYISIGQIAISNFMKYIKKNEDIKYLIEGKGFIKSDYDELIRNSYRGARVECFSHGLNEHCSYIDINSLYPYSAYNMEFPDLRTEQYIYEPFENGYDEFIFYKFGVSTVLLKNESDELGFLMVKMKGKNVICKKGDWIYGTFTNIEIRKALELGYKLIYLKESLIYENSRNLFKDYINKCYELRNNSVKINKYFYKCLMNYFIGKLGQRRNKTEIKIDFVDNAFNYLENGYMIINGFDKFYVYKKIVFSDKDKDFYCPVLPSYITAMGRIKIFEELRKFDMDKLVYSDTDSIIFKGELPDGINISNKMGDFKLISADMEIDVYRKKIYRSDDKLVFAGMKNVKSVKDDSFVYNNMITPLSANNPSEIGNFKRYEVKLNRNYEINEDKLLIDDCYKDMIIDIMKLI